MKAARKQITAMNKLVWLKPNYSAQDVLQSLAELSRIEITPERFGALYVEARQVKQLTELTLIDMHNAAVQLAEWRGKDEQRTA